MPVFNYSGRNIRGELEVGQRMAESSQLIATELMNQGIIPVKINEIHGVHALWHNLSRSLTAPRSLQLVDLVFFTRQLYTLLKASVPLMQALEGLRQTTSNVALLEVINALISSLEQGLDLTTALKKHPGVFTDLYVNLVYVGESTGTLPQVFGELANYLQQEKETRDQIKAAMRYPIFVMLTVGISLMVINIYVIPKFTKMFDKLGADLPVPTQILIGMSDFVIQYWLLLLVSCALGGMLATWYVGTRKGRLRWHWLQLRIPIIGAILFKAALARFALGMATTSRSGLPIEQALRVIGKAVANDFIATKVEKIRVGVERGNSISKTVAQTDLFPPLVVQMIAVGEASGQLDTLIYEVADYYKREVDYAVKSLSAAIEPVLIAIIAGLVVTLALGIFLPMWNMMGIMSHP